MKVDNIFLVFIRFPVCMQVTMYTTVAVVILAEVNGNLILLR